jgi:hypothetical protein
MSFTWLRVRRAREAANTASAPVINMSAIPPYHSSSSTAAAAAGVNPAYEGVGSSYPQATAVPYPEYGGASGYPQQGAAEAYPAAGYGDKGSYPLQPEYTSPDPYPAYPSSSSYPQADADPYPGSAPSYSAAQPASGTQGAAPHHGGWFGHGQGGAFRADGTMAGTQVQRDGGVQGGRNQAVLR